MSVVVLPGRGAAPRPGSPRPDRRHGRRPGGVPALVVALVAAGVVVAGVIGLWVAARGPEAHAVTVRTSDGEVIASVPLTGDRFAVSYRNSVYTTLAEERYRVTADGTFELVEIAADQIAVLEEYYAVPGAPRPAPPGDRRAFVVAPDPARPAVFETLNIAATDLGERTLWVPGHPPVPLWQHVLSEDPTVLVEIEETP